MQNELLKCETCITHTITKGECWETREKTMKTFAESCEMRLIMAKCTECWRLPWNLRNSFKILSDGRRRLQPKQFANVGTTKMWVNGGEKKGSTQGGGMSNISTAIWATVQSKCQIAGRLPNGQRAVCRRRLWGWQTIQMNTIMIIVIADDDSVDGDDDFSRSTRTNKRKWQQFIHSAVRH